MRLFWMEALGHMRFTGDSTASHVTSLGLCNVLIYQDWITEIATI